MKPHDSRHEQRIKRIMAGSSLPRSTSETIIKDVDAKFAAEQKAKTETREKAAKQKKRQQQEDGMYSFVLGEGHSAEESQQKMDQYYLQNGLSGSYKPSAHLVTPTEAA